MQNQMLIATETFKAGGTILANTFVTGGPVAGCTQVASANTKANGVALTAGVAGDMINVATLGVALVTAGAAIAEDAYVGSNATGQAITWASGPVLGRTRGAVAASGQLVEVFLIPAIS